MVHTVGENVVVKWKWMTRVTMGNASTTVLEAPRGLETPVQNNFGDPYLGDFMDLTTSSPTLIDIASNIKQSKIIR